MANNPTFDQFLRPKAVPSYSAEETTYASSVGYQTKTIELPKVVNFSDGQQMAARGADIATAYKEAGVDVLPVYVNPASSSHQIISETDGILVRNRHTEHAVDELMFASTSEDSGMVWQVTAEYTEFGEGIPDNKRPNHTAAEAAELPTKSDRKHKHQSASAVLQEPGRKRKRLPSGKDEKKDEPWISGRVDMLHCLGRKGTRPRLNKGHPSTTTRPIVCVESKRHGMLQRAKTKLVLWSQGPVKDWIYQVGGEECGAITGPVDPGTMRLLQQCGFYAMVYRTQFVELQDPFESILVQFTGVKIRSDVTASELWREGLGKEMELTVLTGTEVQPGTLAFRYLARLNTPLDDAQKAGMSVEEGSKEKNEA
ncbi:hypothetical protein C8034_v001965 [Colletotrichum sidae]|uniref:Uncharacterized protein n=1 Tax=Colletotrichum sidae TaxID=1347389 RepID=A0A4R8PEA2_9PEZI|nr:hypothetical protein C8034_v001965 [Colletotrichum sidae]